MTAEWMTSPTGRRVLVHWADARPAWLWSGDGTRLVWRNAAARLFAGRIRKAGLKLAPNVVPIKGQVARLIRLGSPGRSSLSRIQFLAGGKPVSTTCTCTPLELEDGEGALLIVGVDAIDAGLLESAGDPDPLTETLFPPRSDYLLLDADGRIAHGSPHALTDILPLFEDLPQIDTGETREVTLGERTAPMTRLKANSADASLLVFQGTNSGEAAAAEPHGRPAVDDEDGWEEPLLPMGLEPIRPSEPPTDEAVADLLSDLDRLHPHSLTSLFDRLAEDEELYAGLDDAPPTTADADDAGASAPAPPPATPTPPDIEHDAIAAIIAFDEPEAVEVSAGARPGDKSRLGPAGPTRPKTTRPGESAAPAGPPEKPAAAVTPIEVPTIPGVEPVDKVSRYNFEELGRILNDRVRADDGGRRASDQHPLGRPTRPPKATTATQPEGQLVSLAGESFILNRLPLGILVFRDQQVLFANRAITEMVGYQSVEDLRTAGLPAIFPAAGSEAPEAGPVNHLVQRDGTLVPVTARLQSISWQGRPALMLSASATEVRTGHEAAVRAFAELLAGVQQDGFVETNRNGVIVEASLRARQLLGDADRPLAGTSLALLLPADETAILRDFLERPARFAESARPAISLETIAPDVDLLLFAQGQAGVVNGYFGLVRARPAGGQAPARLPQSADEVEAAVLARVSRSVRRPLNSIIGFADLIRSAAFGAVGDARYVEYARDIRSAGQEIAALVDELDDYTRLRDGRYAARPAEIDLGALLGSCIIRVRGQAAGARVLVRSAISERLPRIRADRASLGQAVLNLLASAIDQTPPGGSVILSAQPEDDGTIAINVRDSSPQGADPDDRFVVFRDGVGRNGEALAPVRSSVGLALTRSLLAVSNGSLSVDPVPSNRGTIFSLAIPPEAVAPPPLAAAD